MGLSASQARLLSITQRLNNNELEAEIISMQKMHLADRNTAACQKYINALDSTSFNYISYNDTGIQEAVTLTFCALNQYTPLKNQYTLFNKENQVYVSSKDAENFENSNTLHDFLDKYGLFNQGWEEFQKLNYDQSEDLRKWKEEKDLYDAKKNAFLNQETAEWQKYNNDKNEWYKAQREAYENSNAYKKYMEYQDAVANNLISTTLQTDFKKAVTTGDVSDTDKPYFHYNKALGNNANCFLHVMNNLLKTDSNTYYSTMKTSNDKSITSLSNEDYTMETLYPTADLIFGDYKELYLCDGKDVGTNGEMNLYEQTRANSGTITDTIKLASDYIEIDNEDGTYSYQLKTLAQKTIDMYYLIANSSSYDMSGLGITVSDVLKNYVEGDMDNIAPTMPEYNPEPFPDPEPTFNENLRDKPTIDSYVPKIYDKPLAQWYTNLWYLMDGNEKSDEISSVYDSDANFDHFTVTDVFKNSPEGNVNKNYVVMSEQDASDSQWLQFAINNGLVYLKQASLKNDLSGTSITWEGIEFTSTSDIRESQDNSKIAKAEAEYKSSLYEIQAEDKKFDAEIKKLDTEHSAFQKEIESIKGVMQKNTEKSFTVFS